MHSEVILTKKNVNNAEEERERKGYGRLERGDLFWLGVR